MPSCDETSLGHKLPVKNFSGKKVRANLRACTRPQLRPHHVRVDSRAHKPRSSRAAVVSHTQLRCFMMRYLVAIERTRCAEYACQKTCRIANGLQQKERHTHRHNHPSVQLARHIAAKLRRGVHSAVGEEIAATLYPLVDGQENRLHQILDIDKREQLAAVSHRKVKARLDALHHQVIISLARTVDPRRAHKHIGKSGSDCKKPFGFELAAAIQGIGVRLVVGTYRRVTTLVAGPPRHRGCSSV